MNLEPIETGGAYEIFVDEGNSSVYVRLLTNDIIGTGTCNTLIPNIKVISSDPSMRVGEAKGPAEGRKRGRNRQTRLSAYAHENVLSS